MIHFLTWMWGAKFGGNDLLKLCDALKRNVSGEYRVVCITDRPDKQMDFIPASFDYVQIGRADLELTKIKGCFARLRLFDPKWQQRIGINEGDRIVQIDLDTVITGNLDALFDRSESFVITQGGNASNPCPYNGCLQMLRAGYHPEVWQDFSLEAAARVPFHAFPDDQGWLAAKLPNAAGWKIGSESGVYVYQKPGWPGYPDKTHTELPEGARLVTFINKHPADVGHLDWVRKHWR